MLAHQDLAVMDMWQWPVPQMLKIALRIYTGQVSKIAWVFLNPYRPHGVTSYPRLKKSGIKGLKTFKLIQQTASAGDREVWSCDFTT